MFGSTIPVYKASANDEVLALRSASQQHTLLRRLLLHKPSALARSCISSTVLVSTEDCTFQEQDELHCKSRTCRGGGGGRALQTWRDFASRQHTFSNPRHFLK